MFVKVNVVMRVIMVSLQYCVGMTEWVCDILSLFIG